MNVLMIGQDQTAVNSNSVLARRLENYGRLAGHLTVLIPAKSSQHKSLSAQVDVCLVGAAFKPVAWVKLLWRSLVINKNVDLVTVQDANYLGLIGYFVAWLKQASLEIQIHGSEKNFWWRLILQRFLIRRATAIRVVSQRLKTELIAAGVPTTKLVVIPIAVPTTFCESHQYESAESAVTFLTVGRLVSVKNISLQLVALAELKKRGHRARLIIVGSGPEELKLKQQADDLSVTAEVDFVGYQTTVKPFYHQADIFLLTSDSEGWGMVVVEAAQAGLPIIMTDVGLAGEVIINGQSGLIISPGRIDELVKAMIELATNPDRRRQLGQTAQLAVVNLPNEDVMSQMIVAHWQKIIQTKL